MSTLTYHGKSEEMCLWVIKTYGDNPAHVDNKGVQIWVEDSKLFLEQLRLNNNDT